MEYTIFLFVSIINRGFNIIYTNLTLCSIPHSV